MRILRLKNCLFRAPYDDDAESSAPPRRDLGRLGGEIVMNSNPERPWLM